MRPVSVLREAPSERGAGTRPPKSVIRPRSGDQSDGLLANDGPRDVKWVIMGVVGGRSRAAQNGQLPCDRPTRNSEYGP